jgi:hypothetical protein
MYDVHDIQFTHRLMVFVKEATNLNVGIEFKARVNYPRIVPGAPAFVGSWGVTGTVRASNSPCLKGDAVSAP